MAYLQVKPFNQKKAGTRKGFCLQNVRLGFGIKAKYPTAAEAWKHTQQHKNRSIPKGLAVPLFYTYGRDGHVNVQLANGKVWSDGTTYSSLAAYEKTHTPKYIGWGESINGVRVLKTAPTTTTIVIEEGTWNVRQTPDGKLYNPRRYARGNEIYKVTQFSDGWAKIPKGWIGPAAYRKIK